MNATNSTPLCTYDHLSDGAKTTALRTLMASAYYRDVVASNLSDDVDELLEDVDIPNYPIYARVEMDMESTAEIPPHDLRLYIEACTAVDVLELCEAMLGKVPPLDCADRVSIVCRYSEGVGSSVDVEAYGSDVEVFEYIHPELDKLWEDVCGRIATRIQHKKENDYYTEDGVYAHLVNHPELVFDVEGRFAHGRVA